MSKIVPNIIYSDKELDIQTVITQLSKFPIHEVATQNNFIFLTEDGKPLISGELVFELHQTHGFPLSITIDEVYSRGFAINWADFVYYCKNSGWLEYQIYDLFEKAIEDCSFSRELKNQFLANMRNLIVSISPELFS